MSDAIVNIIRAIARPAISVIFAAVLAQALVEGITPPPWFLSVAIPCIGWWFVERAVIHKKEGDNT